MDNRAQTLIQQIENAFDGVTLGDGITLHESIALDDYATEDECIAASTVGRDRRWQDVTDAEIELDDCILHFLDREGLRYYLPAFMIWTVNNYTTSGRIIGDTTISACKDAVICSPLINAEQANSIIEFLQYFVDLFGQELDQDTADYKSLIDDFRSGRLAKNAINSETCDQHDEFEIGKKLMKRRRFTDAIEHLLKSLESRANQADQSEIHEMLATCFLEKEQKQTAQFHLLEASHLDPENRSVQFHLGETYIVQGRLPQALECWAKSINRDENSAFAIACRIHMHLDHANAAMAQLLEQISPIQTQNSLAGHAALAFAFALTGNRVRADEQLDKIAEEVAGSSARFSGWADLQHFVDQRKSEMNQ